MDTQTHDLVDILASEIAGALPGAVVAPPFAILVLDRLRIRRSLIADAAGVSTTKVARWLRHGGELTPSQESGVNRLLRAAIIAGREAADAVLENREHRTSQEVDAAFYFQHWCMRAEQHLKSRKQEGQAA